MLDPQVRDTSEMPKSRVKIDKRQWNRTLLPVLDRLRGDLGLPAGCALKAELHSMLVYGPGQFFVPHQDSERADEMVGSLVVTLPTSFTGGALVVEHRGEKARYRSSKKSLSFVAFYADCRHEIQPVKSGCRIVLTYNLVLRGETATAAMAEASPATVNALARCLDEHFTTPIPPPRYGADTATDTDPPNRLVYLLDHEYTARGLSWSRLKGSDARRAAALRAAAVSADCEVVLALADVHETWSAYEPGWDDRWYARRRRWDDWDDDDDDDGWPDPSDPDDYDLEELIEATVTLDAWIDPEGRQAEPIVAWVDDVELCATTPSVELSPYASEYEGYMGNYGNTMDRWYRRCALVVWPRQRAFAVRAEASPSWALDALAAGVRAGDLSAVQEMAATLAPFWDVAARLEQRRGFVTKALRVAKVLDDPALAAMLVGPFPVTRLTRSQATALVALADCYGDSWTADRVARWSRTDSGWGTAGDADRGEWIASLPQLCVALQQKGRAGPSLAGVLVQESWAWLRDAIDSERDIPSPSHRERALGELARPILGVLESAAVIDAADVGAEVVGFLCKDDDDALLACLVSVLRRAEARPKAVRTARPFDATAEHCLGRLEARLARPLRADDDWSIEALNDCRCELCGTLGQFLADSTRRTFEWPLAKERRRHVHGTIDHAELPVSHQTRRSGRPYTLVLTKTEALFEREREVRRRDEADRKWLEGNRSSFVGPRPRR
ncbi:MAG: 2OG-Fe(II) oxygenase [Acidimicrobiales bacterium]